MLHGTKQIIRHIVRKTSGFDLSTLRTKVGNDFLDQKKLLQGKKVSVIFDVGANVGQTTMKYKKIFPFATIYGFEPFVEVFKTYQDVFRGDTRVIKEGIALADHNGTVNFFLNNLSYTNSLLPNNEEYTKNHESYKPIKTIPVPSQMLDSYCKKHSINHIDILKMDVQGGELLVLKGAQKMLFSGKIDLIFSEIDSNEVYKNQPHLEDISAFLEKFGYKHYRTYPSGDSPDSGDAIFLRKDL